MAKACKMYSNTFEKGDSMRKNLVLEGRNYSLKAYYASPSCFESVRWAALMTGLATDYVSMKEKIKLGGEFKEYLDKAIGMRPGEVSLLYMRGRYSYAIANLSWLERKAASALFGAVPQATIDDAIKDLLAPNAWIDNLLFLGKCYIAKKDEVNAVKYLKLATNIKTEDDSDEESLREAYTLLEKYSK
uniref:TPR_REGION domain-containing protein n=1 Tax=Syphacia muris TaxID=451379 RepID=A0A0N5ADS1_9BILA